MDEDKHMADFHALLKKISFFREKAEHAKMITGRAFSVFQQGLIRPDENTASRVLSILLNPHAAHGQGAIFLNAFLGLRPFRCDFPVLAEDVIRVGVERATIGEESRRRIDILVEGKNFIFAIENKLGANDQWHQLSDYLDWLKKRSNGRLYFLIYLTPAGWDPSEATLPCAARARHEGKFFALAWPELLDALQNEVKNTPTRIGDFVSDFCNAIRCQKLGGIGMTDPTHDEIVNAVAFQTSAAELAAAKSIFESYQEATVKIVDSWTKRLAKAVARKTKGSIDIDCCFNRNADEPCYLFIGYGYRNYYRIGVAIFSGYSDGEIMPHDLYCSTVFATWETDRNPQANKRWIEFALKYYDVEALTSNMLCWNYCGNPQNPAFLAKLRQDAKPWLYDDILQACMKVEKMIEEFDHCI